MVEVKHGPKKFRKRPIVIEAMRIDGTKERFDDIWDWACPSNDTLKSPIHCGNKFDGEGGDDYGILYIDTLEGQMIANLGDWIVKGINGEFYPVKPDIFKKTYEEVI